MSGDEPAQEPPRIDAAGTGSAHRPLHARPLLWAVVAAGGALGTAVRDRVAAALPHGDDGWPLATLLVNLAGCVLLGVLLEGLARAGPDAGRRQLVRLAGGTGLCGGLTTYSTLALEVVLLVRRGSWPLAAGYALVSVLAGLVAVAVGIAAATGWHSRRRGGDRFPAAAGSGR